MESAPLPEPGDAGLLGVVRAEDAPAREGAIADCTAAYEAIAEVDATLRGVAGSALTDTAGTDRDITPLLATKADGEASTGDTRRTSMPGDAGTPADAPGARRLRRLRLSPSRMIAAAAGLTAGLTAVALAVTSAGPRSTPGRAGSLLPAPSRAVGRQAPTLLPSAHPSTGSPGPSPSPRLSPSRPPLPAVPPRPSPPAPTSSAAPVPATARLSASIEPGQSDNPFEPAELTFQVGNAGSAATGPLTASITLPGDVQVITDGATSGGWNCQPSANGAACTHSPLSPGQKAEGTLTYTATCGQFSVVAASGSVTATAEQSEAC